MSTIVEPILTITEAARTKVLEVRADEPNPEQAALWIEVNGESAGAYTYLMEFRPVGDACAGDAIEQHDGLAVVIGAGSTDKLGGATLDFTGAGMVMQNPNRPAPPVPWGDRAAPDLSGELAQRLIALLEERINPAIAGHGGRADLVAIDGTVAYLRLSGGCQGCGLASATLSQGIEVAIVEEIPEIERVVDVTDHALGSNPYYEPTKE
jgi:Fe/S biogenesis protein NfuA